MDTTIGLYHNTDKLLGFIILNDPVNFIQGLIDATEERAERSVSPFWTAKTRRLAQVNTYVEDLEANAETAHENFDGADFGSFAAACPH